MPGFPGLAIGAGLGQFAQDYRQQQEAQQRNQMLALTLARFAQEQKQRQDQTQAAAGTLEAMSLPGGSGLPGTMPMQPPQMAAVGGAPQMPAAAPDLGGGLRASGALTGGSNREIATNNFAGMRQPGVPAAGGPMSNPGGWQQFPTPEAGIGGISRQLDRYASGATTGKPLTTLRQIVSTWAPPNENPTEQLIARASQVTGFPPDQPLDVTNPAVKAKLVEAMIRGEQGGKLPVDPSVIQRGIGGGGAPGAGQSQASLPPAVQEAQQGAMQIQKTTPIGQFGALDLPSIVARVNKAMPNASPEARLIAVEGLQKMLAPGAKQEWEAYKLQNQHEFQQMMMGIREQASQTLTSDRIRQQADAAKEKGFQFLPTGDPANPFVRANPNTGVIEPANLPAGTTKMGTSSQAASKPETVDFVAKGIADYTLAPLGGWAMRSKFGQDVMAKVKTLNPEYDQTKYGAKARGAVAFTTGRQSDSIRSFSVAIDHLATMEDAANALANNDVRTLNFLQNQVAREFGYSGPIDFNFTKSIVGAEVSKAVIGGVGALKDREELRDAFSAANSPEQLAGVARQAKRLMAGQLGGYRRQAGSAGFSEADFEKALSPRAKQELETLAGGAPSSGVPGAAAAPAPQAPDAPVSEVIQNGMRFNEKTGEYLGPATP